MPKRDENTARALEEGSRLFHETFKHISTLSTGSIVLLVTFFEKHQVLQWKVSAIIALAGFVMSTLGAVLLLMFLSKDVSIRSVPTPRDWLFTVGSWITSIVFVLSIFSLTLFAIRNLL